MDLVVWWIFVSFFAIAKRVSSDHVVHPNVLSSEGLSGYALELLLSKHDLISHKLQELRKDVQELREDVHEQRKFMEGNQQQFQQTLELLANMQLYMEQEQMNEAKRHTETQKAIAAIQHNQEQSFELLGILPDMLQQEMQNQRNEVARDRQAVSKWQVELQTLIRTNQNETARILKEGILPLLRNIATNRDQSITSFNTLQSKLQQQQEDATYRQKMSQKGIADIQSKQERNLKSLETVKEKLNGLETQLSTHRDETMNNRNENLKRMEQLQRYHKEMRSIMNMHPGPYRSCKEVQRKVSGIYNIRGKDIFNTFEAYCEQDKFDGGWMVIQYRFNGSLSFYRSWTDYRNGFGEVDGEHWLGLEHIHQFTKDRNCELLIEMKDFYNNSKYARYDSFGIGSEAEQYRLTILGTYTGTAGDSLTPHKGMMFSTPDRDNDVYTDYNCAKKCDGGWWFTKCYFAFLNGLYRNVSGLSIDRIAWDGFSSDKRGLSFSRMLIRPMN